MHFAISGHTMPRQPSPEESSVRSFCCSHCSLVFTSKISLFKHVTFEHGSEADKDHADSQSNRLESFYLCDSCGFIAHGQEGLKEHEKQCGKKLENPNPTGNPIVPEKGAVVSTSKSSSCTLNSSKDLKTYKGPLQMQTITKFLTASPRPSSVKSAESPVPLSGSTGTLLLQQSPSDLSPSSSGVFKVTAMSTIDMSCGPPNHCMVENHFLLSELRSHKPKEQSNEPVYENSKKRSSRGRPESQPAKRTKTEEEETKLSGNEDESKQLSGSTDFSFEISDDEQERKFKLSKRDGEIPNTYFCKHCDYSDAVVRLMSFHYQSDHPYIRCSATYIQNPSDQSVTFRCLECPIEFLAEAHLQKHYTEKHPDAPKVFMRHSCELVYKCFVCKFISNELKALTEHYKEEHPTHKADDSLLFCKYTAPVSQEGSSEMNTCREEHSPGSSGGISPKNKDAQPDEIKNAPSPLPPTSRGEEVVLYHCSSCLFSHKSAVGMHFHYQRKHPDEMVTINKIKQSASVSSQTTSQTTAESSSNVTENSVSPKDDSDSPETERSKAEASQQMLSSPLTSPKNRTYTSRTHSESPRIEKVKPEADLKKTKTPPGKWNRELLSGIDGSSCSSLDKMFYCQFCTFSNTNIRSVVAHHNMKHAEQGLTGTEEVWWYNNKLQKKKLQSEAETSTSAASPHSKSSERVEGWKEKKRRNEEATTSKTEVNPYERVEDLFYCQFCNLANVSLKGIKSHQAKIHTHLTVKQEHILKHTALIRAEIKKSPMKDSSSPSSSFRLPLPLMNEGDTDSFFCHFCNYRHNSTVQVVKHYISRHPGFVVKNHQVLEYTSTLLKQMEESHPETSASREDSRETLQEKVTKKKKVKTLAKSSSALATQPQRTLRCYRCTYSCQSVNLLRRHMLNVHKTNRRTTDILRVCYRQGMLKTGYHCDRCAFSHKSAAVVFQHSQQQHPQRKVSLEYVSTRLYVGPESFVPKRKEKHKKSHTGDGSDGDGRTGQSETEMFSCKVCSFKGSSMSTITRHNCAVHPWSVRDNGSGQNIIITSRKSSPQIVEDPTEIPESFDSYQAPLGHGDSPDSSDEAADCSNWFKCKHCTAWFSTWHGLNTHSGMKHPDELIDGTAHVHVFKCPHCTYINASYHGVLTHCQMSHPDSESSADSHFMDEMHLRSWNNSVTKKGSGDTSRISGYMCEACPQISATPEKLSRHCEREHNKTDPSPDPNTMHKPSAVRKLRQPNTHSSLGSVSKASVLQKKRYSVLKCQLCSYKCSTKIGLGRHMRVIHRHLSYSQFKDCVYKCALCPKSYQSKRHLARHYTIKHGKLSLAKYFTPLYPKLTALKAPNTPKPSTQGEDGKILVYKCPSCPYVNASYHGTLTHCQMMHPTLVVRADRLQTDTIIESQMVHSWSGKGSKHKGFACKKCPLIYPSLSQLTVHSVRSHRQAQPAASELSVETETEEQPDHGSGGSTPEASSLIKMESSPVNVTQTDHDQQPGSPDPLHVSLQKNGEILYECDLCAYAGICRKYLHCHYKNMHKMDTSSISKQLEKYNKRKRFLPKVPSEERVRCKKCPHLVFDTSQLLIVHYTNFHSSNFKMDFKVIKGRTKNNPGLFKCDHCSKYIVGTRKLCHHLERHERGMKRTEMDAEPRASVAVTTAPEAPTNEIFRQDEPPMLEPVQDLTHWNETPVKEEESMEDKRTCRQCGRSFMSLKGLRSHERSHAALAAIKKLDKLSSSLMKHNIDEYVVFKAGTLRPFLCNFCPFRTTVFALWRGHFIRKHQDVFMNDVETENEDEENNQDLPQSSEENSNSPEPDEEDEIAERSMYLEPPDVQRQLNHYSLMAQTGRAAKAEVLETELPVSCLLHCELCSFTTGHLSSVRRHYLNRHGKKILKCKDCEFFTALRKTLEMHMEASHSTFQSEPTHLRDLRCPLCLYQTRNKNNMIDHIVLHREERVVPIELRRPRLSRYLQGIVFRCHKCTFSCGSAENLRLHITKHDDVKPYKCRLCYFDCSQLSDLEAHLSDKHQVERNHELVGQVSLDQLEAQDGRMAEEEEEEEEEKEEEEEEKEEPLSNSEQHNSPREDVKIRLVSGCKEVKHETLVAEPAEDDPPKKVTEQVKDTCLKHEQETAGGQMIKPTVEMNVKKGNTSESEESDGSERERQTNENQAQLQVRGSEDKSLMSTCQREEAAERDSATCNETEDKKESKFSLRTLQHRSAAIESRAEDKILRHILVLDEDGSVHKTHNKAEHERIVKNEQSLETKVLDNVLSELLDEEPKMSLAHKMTTKCDSEAKTSLMQGNNLRSREDLKCGSPSRTPLPVGDQLNEESSGLSLTNCKEERVSQQEHVEEPSDPYGDMPVLENEYLKETPHPKDGCKEEEEDELQQREDEGDEAFTEDDESGCKDREHEEGDGTEEANSPREGKSGVTAAGGAPEVPRPSVTGNKLYACELCGRNLSSGSDLKRHIMRHGI